MTEALSLDFVTRLVAQRHVAPDTTALYRGAMAREDIAIVPDFFDPDIFEALREEVRALLDEACRRDFVMGTYETPRAMSVVGGQTILRVSPRLAALYVSFPMIEFLSTIVGRRLNLSAQIDAFMTINHLQRPEDTQGWHLDDGSHAVIFAFDTPGLGKGGELEYIKDWPELEHGYRATGLTALPDMIDAAARSGLLRRVSLPDNAMYILKSDTSLHRVAPLSKDARPRTVIAAGFETDRVAAYSHTGADLYQGA